MSFRLLEQALSPAEGETTVRTYHSTSLSSRMLSLKAEGYLTVTNKRVVFYAEGSSFAGRSVLQSEVPIADVSGINCYKGTHFSIGRFLIAMIVSLLVGVVFTGVVGALTVSWLSGQNYRTAQSSIQGMVWLLWFLAGLGVVASFGAKKASLSRSMLAASATTLAGALSGLGALAGGLGNLVYFGGVDRNLGMLLTLGGAVYAFVCFFWYARGETMSLSIGSKGGMSAPISISGISSFGVYSSSAGRALSAAPAADADVMIRQLGAVIMDIQALGDFGIQKWQQQIQQPAPSLIPSPAGA